VSRKYLAKPTLIELSLYNLWLVIVCSFKGLTSDNQKLSYVTSFSAASSRVISRTQQFERFLSLSTLIALTLCHKDKYKAPQSNFKRPPIFQSTHQFPPLNPSMSLTISLPGDCTKTNSPDLILTFDFMMQLFAQIHILS
jgi:hypothetical protein